MDATERQVGSYRLLERLSPDRWSGEHLTLDRPVELRRLSRVTSEQRAGLVETMRDLDRLRPPHLEAIHDLLDDPDEEGVIWLIGEQLQGPTLAERIRSGPLPIGQVRGLAEDLLAGLAAIHAGGLVHSNISPLQIRMTPDGPRLQGCVSARVEDHSWQHLAPEQWSRREPSPASDIYALGLCLYEALVGTSPFPPGLPRGEYARLHTQSDVPDVRQRRPEVPEPLALLVQDATRRNLKKRLHNAQEAIQRLYPPAAPPAPAPEPVPAPAPAPEPLPEPEPLPPPPERPTARALGATGCLLAPLGLGLLVLALLALGVWALMGEGGVAALLHAGPRLTLTNPTPEPLTVACTSGEAAERVGMEIPAQGQTLVLLSGAPAECVVFNAQKEVRLRWAAASLPPSGTWEAAVPAAEDGAAMEDTAAPPPEIRLEVVRDTGEARPAAPDTPAVAQGDPTPSASTGRTSGGSSGGSRSSAGSGGTEDSDDTEGASAGRTVLVVKVASARRRWTRGMDVRVDGVRVGEAPSSWEVTPGRHEVRWYKAGFDHTCAVNVPSGGRTVAIDPDAPVCP